MNYFIKQIIIWRAIVIICTDFHSDNERIINGRTLTTIGMCVFFNGHRRHSYYLYLSRNFEIVSIRLYKGSCSFCVFNFELW